MCSHNISGEPLRARHDSPTLDEIEEFEIEEVGCKLLIAGCSFHKKCSHARLCVPLYASCAAHFGRLPQVIGPRVEAVHSNHSQLEVALCEEVASFRVFEGSFGVELGRSFGAEARSVSDAEEHGQFIVDLATISSTSSSSTRVVLFVLL